MGWQNIHINILSITPRSFPWVETHHITSPSPLLWEIQKTVRARHAHVAWRRRQRSHTRWTPQAHGRHVVRRPSNTVRWRHKLYRLRRKRLLGERHAHDLRRHPVEGGDELPKDLEIGCNAAANVLSLPMWCRQYSGAPTYSNNRGSCKWMP